MGILAVLTAPLVGKAVERIDARLIVSVGIVGLGLISVWRMGFTPDVTFGQMALPTLITGPFMVMFFVPVTGLAMASVEPDEQANAAGLSNFMRTLAGAFATSLVQTGWSDATRHNQTELAGVMNFGEGLVQWMRSLGATRDQAVELLTHLIEGQSLMLATLNMFAMIAICFGFAATLIWIAPKPQGPIDTSGAH
jgi:DHA2 family multidrug resistance protein